MSCPSLIPTNLYHKTERWRRIANRTVKDRNGVSVYTASRTDTCSHVEHGRPGSWLWLAGDWPDPQTHYKRLIKSLKSGKTKRGGWCFFRTQSHQYLLLPLPPPLRVKVIQWEPHLAERALQKRGGVRLSIQSGKSSAKGIFAVENRASTQWSSGGNMEDPRGWGSLTFTPSFLNIIPSLFRMLICLVQYTLLGRLEVSDGHVWWFCWGKKTPSKCLLLLNKRRWGKPFPLLSTQAQCLGLKLPGYHHDNGSQRVEWLWWGAEQGYLHICHHVRETHLCLVRPLFLDFSVICNQTFPTECPGQKVVLESLNLRQRHHRDWASSTISNVCGYQEATSLLHHEMWSIMGSQSRMAAETAGCSSTRSPLSLPPAESWVCSHMVPTCPSPALHVSTPHFRHLGKDQWEMGKLI